jgi:hypothetical protein
MTGLVRQRKLSPAASGRFGNIPQFVSGFHLCETARPDTLNKSEEELEVELETN